MFIRYKEIPVIKELERNGTPYEFSGEDWIKIKCPYHKDEDPSLAINLEERYFHCKGCTERGTIVDLLSTLSGQNKDSLITDLLNRYDLSARPVLNIEPVKDWHGRIFDYKDHMHELKSRGITKTEIEKYLIGVDPKAKPRGRITIPVFDNLGNLINVRKYDPFAESTRKTLNTKGHGKIALYPIEQLKYPTIMLCGGELKAIAAAKQLNEKGIGAISTTAGEGSWDDSFTSLFKDKNVIVCFDIDQSGKRASLAICRKLYTKVNAIGYLELPLSAKEYPKGDVNDFIANGGNLLSVLETVVPFEPSWEKCLDEEPKLVSFNDTVSAKITGQRLQFSARVTSICKSPYSVPKQVHITCDQNQKVCGGCPVHVLQKTEYEIHAEDAPLLAVIDGTEAAVDRAIASCIGVPKSCRSWAKIIEEYYSMEKIRISQCMDLTEDGIANKDQQEAIFSGDIELNCEYEFTGRVHPNPNNQIITFQLSNAERKADSLNDFKMKHDDKFNIFQPASDSQEDIQRKLDEIYSDLEANVTEIYSRRDMHLVADLAYHSPLWIKGNIKGWVEVLLLGDTGQGKSQLAMRLRDFYQLGEYVSAKSATYAGIMGGLKQQGTSTWWVEWGAFPSNDRRLVIVEEFSGLSTTDIAKLTDARTSGLVKLSKIEKSMAYCRTRMVCLSNPRQKTIRDKPYGILTTLDLIGQQQDIRRFDMIYIVSKEAIPGLTTLLRDPPQVESRYTAELCRQLVLWAWTGNVEITREAEIESLIGAEELAKKYECDLEVLSPATTHDKILRLAAALAARLYSHNEDMSILVKKCHVEYIKNFIDKHYSSEECGYASYAKFNRSNEQVNEEELKNVFKTIGEAKRVIRAILSSPDLDFHTMRTLISTNRDISDEVIHRLTIINAIKRERGRYHIRPNAIRLMKKFEANGVLDAPDFIKEEF